jgi:hypothetical protein
MSLMVAQPDSVRRPSTRAAPGHDASAPSFRQRYVQRAQERRQARIAASSRRVEALKELACIPWSSRLRAALDAWQWCCGTLVPLLGLMAFTVLLPYKLQAVYGDALEHPFVQPYLFVNATGVNETAHWVPDTNVTAPALDVGAGGSWWLIFAPLFAAFACIAVSCGVTLTVYACSEGIGAREARLCRWQWAGEQRTLYGHALEQLKDSFVDWGDQWSVKCCGCYAYFFVLLGAAAVGAALLACRATGECALSWRATLAPLFVVALLLPCLVRAADDEAGLWGVAAGLWFSIGLPIFLTLLLVALHLDGKLDSPFMAVFSPVWIVPGLGLLGGAIGCLVACCEADDLSDRIGIIAAGIAAVAVVGVWVGFTVVLGLIHNADAFPASIHSWYSVFALFWTLAAPALFGLLCGCCFGWASWRASDHPFLSWRSSSGCSGFCWPTFLVEGSDAHSRIVDITRSMNEAV